MVYGQCYYSPQTFKESWHFTNQRLCGYEDENIGIENQVYGRRASRVATWLVCLSDWLMGRRRRPWPLRILVLLLAPRCHLIARLQVDTTQYRPQRTPPPQAFRLLLGFISFSREDLTHVPRHHAHAPLPPAALVRACVCVSPVCVHSPTFHVHLLLMAARRSQGPQ